MVKKMQVIQCKTKDNEVVGVPLDWLRQSKTLKTMLDNMILDLNDPNLVFPVSALTSPIFKKCMEWCQHHIGVPDAVVTCDPITYNRIWFEMNWQERQFFKIELKELKILLLAANYLDIKSLYLYTAQALAALLIEKQENFEEVRALTGEQMI
uniref:SKP1 component POZ domain-containing protein n=1 Tax=Ditylenchus dipsaci TaxID=166011 RepID=A0A915EJL4_9BILA